jgi:SAM-dependent methyltransferase
VTSQEARISRSVTRPGPFASIDPRLRSRFAMPLPPPLQPHTGSPWPDEIFDSGLATKSVALQRQRGGSVAVDPHRWHSAPGAADRSVLERTRGAVLDIGCGPGRLVHALVEAGRVALGIDASAAAVAATHRRGAPAVHTSVFGPVPLTGQWDTALLIDGNIGIGGDPMALLRQVGSLITPSGVILAEVESAPAISENIEVRVDHGGRVGHWFPWSRVAAADVPALAQSAGLVLDDLWQHSGRWFAQLALRNAAGEALAC